jgi:hypothetical protein
LSNSVFVSLHRLPLTLGEVQQAIYRAFEGFDLSRPEVLLHQVEGPPKSIVDSIVMVRGKGEHDHCWVSFGEYPQELTGADAATHMGDVTTRGSWLFAGIVTLALFEFGGARAFNDSGELDGQVEYDVAALRQVIADALASGKQYLTK